QHMLFFVADLESSLIRMARFLTPGGGLFIVLADESDGYTGHALRAFIEAGGETAPAEPPIWSFILRHDRAIDNRDPGRGRGHREARGGTASSRRAARAGRSPHRARWPARVPGCCSAAYLIDVLANPKSAGSIFCAKWIANGGQVWTVNSRRSILEKWV